MGTKRKQKTINGFTENQIKNWENSDGVNFAIALSRITGWLLQVDWWASDEDDDVENIIPLRVYVATDTDSVFDFNGKKKIEAYVLYNSQPIALKRAKGKMGGILNKFYSESKLRELPLRVKASEIEISKAYDAIIANQSFLDKIPKRLNPHIPAEIAAHFMFGYCVVFAQAKKDIDRLPAKAIIVSKFKGDNNYTKLGFCHSVIIHPDGEAEDSWGKQPLTQILEKFDIESCTLSEEMQAEISDQLLRNSPENYKKFYDIAVNLIRQDNLINQ